MRGNQGQFTMALVSFPFLLYPLMLPPRFDALLCATSNLFQHRLGARARSLATMSRYRNIPPAALHPDTETF
ncbi:hypothetical protein V2W45_1474751 [Cenococcum geophilum]